MVKIVLTDDRDVNQSVNYEIPHNLTREALYLASKAGFYGAEIRGGGKENNYLAQNKIPNIEGNKDKFASGDMVTEALIRDFCLNNFNAKSPEEVQAYANAMVGQFDKARIFNAENSTDATLEVIRAFRKEGFLAEGTISLGSYDGEPTQDINFYLNYAKDMIDAGATSINVKDFAGSVNPKKVYDVIKSLKDNLPDHIEVSYHNHCTNVAMQFHESNNEVRHESEFSAKKGVSLPEAQIDMAIKAGADVIHAAGPGVSGGFGQFNVRRIIEKHGDKIQELNIEALEKYYAKTEEIGKQYPIPSVREYLEKQTKGFLEIYKEEYGEEKFTEMIKERYKADNLNQALEISVNQKEELIYKAAVPGGGFFNTLRRMEKNAVIGDKVETPLFIENDMVTEYLKTLYEDVRPKLGMPNQVTPDYKRTDEVTFKRAVDVLKGQASKDDPLTFDKGRGLKLDAELIVIGEAYKLPQQVDSETKQLVFKERVSKELKGQLTFLKTDEIVEAFIKSGEKINKVFEVNKKVYLLGKQVEDIQTRIDEGNNVEYFSKRKESAEKDLDKLKKDKNYGVVSYDDYISLMKKGDGGAKVTEKIKNIVQEVFENSGLQTSAIDHIDLDLGKVLRASTEFKASTGDITESKLDKVRELLNQATDDLLQSTDTGGKKYIEVIRTKSQIQEDLNKYVLPAIINKGPEEGKKIINIMKGEYGKEYRLSKKGKPSEEVFTVQNVIQAGMRYNVNNIA